MYSFTYLLLDAAYRCIAQQIPPLIPFSTINNVSISVNNFNSTFALFNYAFHALSGADKK